MKDLLSNAKISVKEEKDTVAKISQLESVIPFAVQYDEYQKVLKEKI